MLAQDTASFPMTLNSVKKKVKITRGLEALPFIKESSKITLEGALLILKPNSTTLYLSIMSCL